MSDELPAAGLRHTPTGAVADPKERRIADELSATQLAEAHRIAGELVKLHRDGAIKSARDAEVYAGLIKAFGATYAGPPPAAAGEHPPDLVPQPPRGISPQERMEFYKADLADAFGDQPTAVFGT